MSSERPKPITDTKIPGTAVPDVSAAQVESDQHKRWMSSVAVSTALMAALASISSMLAGGHLNEAMIEQIRASDQWAYFQAKGIKGAIVESRIDQAGEAGSPALEADRQRLARYKSEQEDIKSGAQARQSDADKHRRQYAIISRAATALQIGIGVAAVALLLRKNVFWIIALIAGAAGVAFLVQGLMGDVPRCARAWNPAPIAGMVA